jgi:hypothetical protein
VLKKINYNLYKMSKNSKTGLEEGLVHKKEFDFTIE